MLGLQHPHCAHYIPSPPKEPKTGNMWPRPRIRQHSGTSSPTGVDPGRPPSPEKSSGPHRHRRSVDVPVQRVPKVAGLDCSAPSVDVADSTVDEAPEALYSLATQQAPDGEGEEFVSGSPPKPAAIGFTAKRTQQVAVSTSAPFITPRTTDKGSATSEPNSRRCAVCGRGFAPDDASLTLDSAHVVHRVCFICSTCHEPLTLANFHLVPSAVAASTPSLVCTTHHVERLESKNQPT